MYRHKKKGIALLITLMFVIVISVAVGFGLKTVNKTSQGIAESKMLFQATAVVQDVIDTLETIPQIKQLKKKDDIAMLYAFLSQASIIPLHVNDMRVLISIQSARSKFNPNRLAKNAQAVENLKVYVNNYAVSSSYVDLLRQCIRKYEAKNEYNYDTRLFDKYPKLFAEYIASKKQIQQINDFYKNEYNEDTIDKLDLKNLFYYTKEENTFIDLNYATPEVWQLLLNVSQERALELNENGGAYTDVKSLGLNIEEKHLLKKFKTSFYEPYIYITINIETEKSHAKIAFEYNIKKGKGSNFVFQI